LGFEEDFGIERVSIVDFASEGNGERAQAYQAQALVSFWDFVVGVASNDFLYA